ncbi:MULTISPECIES: sel1 repeat family protein [Paraburkholderia]|uniref:Sel1 repeat family protein n=1 Tax=Paraburkholderia podalyriae TaxID=1938811 RepID=A0ABR7Q312_9BURK|nr:sel1 repeat family protein [Paraburkholderia podalyriae]MBC8752945.1 sel1 repeat family protein [Paraburkholderia podalyriae]
MSVDSSWLGQIEREWAQLRQSDPALDIEKFFRHVVSANKVGFLSLESIAAIANGLLTSPLPGAPYLGRRLLERVGPDRHPSLRVALALSLVTETGGPADFEGGHVILGDVLKDDMASDPLRGMAAAALADSARLGRGMDTDLEMAKDMYATALELGHRSAAYNLGLYWEGRWGTSAPGDVVPDSTKAAQAYKRGGSNAKCAARLDALRTRSR